VAGSIVLLNGTGSAGKTSIARAMQELCAEPVLHMGMDNFYIQVCPPKFLFRMVPPGVEVANAADEPESVLFFEPGDDPAAREAGTSIVVPRFGRQLMSGMHHSVAALARLGHRVVVDHVLWVPEWLTECLELWREFPVLLVGVHCPLPVLEAREMARGDRSAKGVVRWQYSRVHQHGGRALPYDLEVDTSVLTPHECAERVLARWLEGPPGAGFRELAG
jgi:chloramphenicol 3-O phosphotransferase